MKGKSKNREAESRERKVKTEKKKNAAGKIFRSGAEATARTVRKRLE